MSYSIIIKNGMVFDGTGAPFIQADIGIAEDKIKKIGNLQNESAGIIIDASNKCVAPGFIDLATHSDTHWTLFSQPTQESFIRQGVTTIIGGHAGSSLAPLVRQENIETIQKWVDVSKININWQNMWEFLAELEKHKFGVNFGTFVGLGTIRRGIVAEEARPAQNEELKQMQVLVEKSLEEGAFGLSLNLGAAHQKSATDEEIIALLKTAKAFNIPAVHHLEDEGKGFLSALVRLISLARNSGIRSHINHFKGIGKTAWEYFPQGLEMIEQARKEKIDLSCDFFPYDRTGSSLYMLLPDWARESGKERILNLIRAKERKNILEFLKNLTLHYEKITIASTLHDFDVVGKNILELSQGSGISPEETILKLLEVNNLQVAIFNEAISEKNIELLAGQDWSMFASDGVGYAGNYRSKTDLPHPRSFGAFCRGLAIFAKEKNTLSWEKAIFKMTGFPAKILGLNDRGLIKKGHFADFVIFNPETISDQATYENPYQFPQGLDYVLINGSVVLKENSLIKPDSGRVLRRS